MERKTVRLMMICIMFVVLTGCGKDRTDSTTDVPGEKVKAESGANDNDAAPIKEHVGETGAAGPDETAEGKETVEYQVTGVSAFIKNEAEVNLVEEDGQVMTDGTDIILSDTVEYVKSDRKEIMETRQVESVVNENDPSTYKVIQKEQEVETVEEIPIEYTDSSGNVKYAFRDGSWYVYKYSSGDITVTDEEDEETVLLLLNMFGEYDDYEVVNMECSVVKTDGMEPQYAYRVLYQKEEELTGPPDNLEKLTVSKTVPNVTRKKEIIEEKVPVTLEEEVGTGEYIYYGWQELDEGIYYFDKNGEKVTGMQVIEGVRYLFDEHGVLIEESGVNVSSRNGNIDWRLVSMERLDLAMIRCGYRGSSEGMLVQDARCEENIVGSREAGMDVSIWFYSQAVNEKEAVEEASFVVAMARKYEITSPLILATGHSSDFDGRADSLSVQDRTTYVEAFCRTVQNAGYTPMIFGNEDWLNNGLDMSRLESYPLCLAEYDSNITYTGSCDIWQYTAKASIDGISGYTGLSIRP